MIYQDGVYPGFADHPDLWIDSLRARLTPVTDEYSGRDYETGERNEYGRRRAPSEFHAGVPSRPWAKPKVPEGACAALIDGEFSSGCGGVP